MGRITIVKEADDGRAVVFGLKASIVLIAEVEVGAFEVGHALRRQPPDDLSIGAVDLSRRSQSAS